MKFLRLISMALIFCASCTQNNDEVEIVQKLQKGEERNLFLTEPVKDNVKDENERIMYMASFLIGKAIIENKDARHYFNRFITNKRTKKIELASLLDSDLLDENPFEIAFHEQFNNYNWHTSPTASGGTPPKSAAIPDPFRWGGILDSQMSYYQYLIEIIENRKLEIYFPNKELYINDLQDLIYYLNNHDVLTCLWSLDKFTFYSDGLILKTDGSGHYLPENFDPENANSLIFILRDKLD
ncbi:conserved protein of unknown function [Tenacibaculum sp. 190130A14a]|uniref:Lipoprotein n=1 Tax=Tenacibaculum polynesiense TaxID=3137857 RepID=A0ABM9P7T7_9FLAO